MKPSAITLLLLPLLLYGACAPRQSSGGGPATVVPRENRDLLEPEDLQDFTTALMAIRATRGQWLRVRGGSFDGMGQVQVYTDGIRVGGPEVLERMSTVAIGSIQYFDGRDALLRWGLGHENGVIYVTSRRH